MDPVRGPIVLVGEEPKKTSGWEKFKSGTNKYVGELTTDTVIKKEVQVINGIATLLDEPVITPLLKMIDAALAVQFSEAVRGVFRGGVHNILGALQIYSLYKNIVDWIKPLSKDRVDVKKVVAIFDVVIKLRNYDKTSSQVQQIDSSGSEETVVIEQPGSEMNIRTIPSVVRSKLPEVNVTTEDLRELLDEVLEDNYEDEVRFINALKNRVGIKINDPIMYQAIFSAVEHNWDQIYIPASIGDTIAHICFTITDAAGVARLLDGWGLIDLGKIAASIGGSAATTALQYFGPIIGGIAAVGLGGLVVSSVVKICYAYKDDDKNALWKAAWNTAIFSIECVSTVIGIALPIIAGAIAAAGVTAAAGTALATIGPYALPVTGIGIVIMVIAVKGIGLIGVYAKSFKIEDEKQMELSLEDMQFAYKAVTGDILQAPTTEGLTEEEKSIAELMFDKTFDKDKSMQSVFITHNGGSKQISVKQKFPYEKDGVTSFAKVKKIRATEDGHIEITFTKLGLNNEEKKESFTKLFERDLQNV